MKELKTYKELIEEHEITMECTHHYENPNMPDSNNMDHWLCEISKGDEVMETYFSMGMGHNGNEPDLETVLDCLSSDSSMVENAENDDGFEGWANELGFDTDSRKAEKTYNVSVKQAEEFCLLLGVKLYNTMLWDTERL